MDDAHTAPAPAAIHAPSDGAAAAAGTSLTPTVDLRPLHEAPAAAVPPPVHAPTALPPSAVLPPAPSSSTPSVLVPAAPSFVVSQHASIPPAVAAAPAAARVPKAQSQVKPGKRKPMSTAVKLPGGAAAHKPYVAEVSDTMPLEDLVLACLREPDFVEFTRSVASIFVEQLL